LSDFQSHSTTVAYLYCKLF